MGRRSNARRASNTAFNRRKGTVQTQHVQLNDPFPADFLGFLCALPSNDASGNASTSTDNASDDATTPTEPPNKRSRIEYAEAIPIARESITIERPAQLNVLITDLVSRIDVNRHVIIRYDESRHILTISSITRSYATSFKSELELGRPLFTKSTLAVLKVLSQSRDGDSDEGALWVGVAVDLERKDNKDQVKISLQLNWNSSTDPLRAPGQRALSQTVLDVFLASWSLRQGDNDEKLSSQDFYDAAFTPERDSTRFPSLLIPMLTARLFPFQRRALQWLLSKEGVQWSDCCANGETGLEPIHEASTDRLPLSFKAGKDADGQLIYISDLYHIVTRDITPFRTSENSMRGGILAEEMGLGKTVEIIALICMHTRKNLPNLVGDIPQTLRPTGATLIVTPGTLQSQWIAEFKKHAPLLRVTVYRGLKRDKGEDEEELVSRLAEHDVVMTTYHVLQTEIHFAKEPPDRSRRHDRKYQRRNSPLTQISWWRVCLDEAQQIESGVSNAAKVARWIPRVNNWGITGTPVKENIEDLWGLLVFLRYEPFASSLPIWEALITSHKDLFKPLFSRISLRHSKHAIRDELSLPPQKRYVITTPFIPVEQQHYTAQFRELMEEAGLREDGTPFYNDWDPEDPLVIDLLKCALAQLRQTALHASLGPKRLLRNSMRNKVLRTVEEMLDVMIEQSDAFIKTNQRNYYLKKLERGRVLEQQSEIAEAIRVWQQVEAEVKVLEEECRKQLQVELEKANQAKSDEDPEGGESDDDSDEKATNSQVSECRRKLRSMLDLHHRAIFFIASGYYQIKTDVQKTIPDSEEFKLLEEKETSGYEVAKNIRKEILHEPRTKALSHIAKLQEKSASQSFVEIPEMSPPTVHSLRGAQHLTSAELLSDALNKQADLIDDWRETIIGILRQPLVDEEDDVEVTGEEYEESTKIQDELMVYTLALRAAIADRQTAITGLENERVNYETRLAIRQATDGQGHAPEKTITLLERREKARPPPGTSFRGVIAGLRELAATLRTEINGGSSRAAIELSIVDQQVRQIQEQSSAQSKVAEKLERELRTFTLAMNSRVEYYRQLQGISDTVAPLEMERAETPADIQARVLEEESLKAKIDKKLPRHRYLVHLKESPDSVEEICIICQSPFTAGVLTICGHQFCTECIKMWFKTRRNCPVCKTGLTSSALHNIVLKKQKLTLHQEQLQGSRDAGLSAQAKRLGIYSEFSSQKLEAIRSINSRGASFGTKADALAKHLIWLRVEDPGAKSVIFSQFRGFLDILSRALSWYGVGHSSFDYVDGGIKKFKEDPAIECFLMDARAHAGGLNLVNASHVFLCEPLLNTALELQAIARVDRIGQEHPTTVWLYLIEGTVEESIYNMSVQRRLEHAGRGAKGKSREPAGAPEVPDLFLEQANSMELRQADLAKLMSKDKALGEVVRNDDLWQCLFGHVARDRESASGLVVRGPRGVPNLMAC